MTDHSLLPFDLPSVRRKKVSAAFDGGLVLLREAERSLRLAETLAGCIRDRRNQAQGVHPLSAMLRFRMFAIPRAAPLARAEFATLRLRLLKIGARVVEKATRGSASTSPRPAPTPLSSACLQAAPPQQAPERRGDVPRSPRLLQPSTQYRPTSDPGAKPRQAPTRSINRASTERQSMNRAG